MRYIKNVVSVVGITLFFLRKMRQRRVSGRRSNLVGGCRR